MEPNAWKGFFRSYVLGQWYCYIFNMILKNNNQDLNWYWNALWLSSHSFWKLRNCIQASKWKKSWVGVQVFACDVAVESDHVVIRNSRSQFKTTSSSRKSEGDFTPCVCFIADLNTRFFSCTHFFFHGSISSVCVGWTKSVGSAKYNYLKCKPQKALLEATFFLDNSFPIYCTTF